MSPDFRLAPWRAIGGVFSPLLLRLSPPEIAYAPCALTRLACAVLLLRGYRANRARQLFRSGLCFAALPLSCAVAGLHFLRFWTLSRDRFLVLFALAFWALAAHSGAAGVALRDDRFALQGICAPMRV